MTFVCSVDQISVQSVRAICTKIQKQTKWCLFEKSELCKCRFCHFHPSWGDFFWVVWFGLSEDAHGIMYCLTYKSDLHDYCQICMCHQERHWKEHECISPPHTLFFFFYWVCFRYLFIYLFLHKHFMIPDSAIMVCQILTSKYSCSNIMIMTNPGNRALHYYVYYRNMGKRNLYSIWKMS